MRPTSPARLPRRALAHALVLALAGAAFADATSAASRERAPARRPPGASAVPAPAGANFSVTTCADSGAGSLRQAMLDARNNTTIDFSQLTCSTITLTTGALTDPDTDSLRLTAPFVVVDGRPQPRITIDAGGASRAIEHRSGGSLELFGLHVRNGAAHEKGGCVYAMGHVRLLASAIDGCTVTSIGNGNALGGGVWSDDQVDMLASVVSNNHAHAPNGYAYGGGVFTPYGLVAQYSRFSQNEATGISYGGGVSVRGPASVLNCTIDGNRANYGAGIALFGGDVGPEDLRIVNSTIAGNTAGAFASGIEANGTLNVFNSTIAGNVGELPSDTGGIGMQGSHTLNLVSSIVFGNRQAGAAKDIGGTGTLTGSHNLIGHSAFAPPPDTIGADPLLAPLADNRGQTPTMRLSPTSPAIDHGSNPTGTLCDQRTGLMDANGGLYRVFPRTVGAAPDIGAYEVDDDRLFDNGFDPRGEVVCNVPDVHRAGSIGADF